MTLVDELVRQARYAALIEAAAMLLRAAIDEPEFILAYENAADKVMAFAGPNPANQLTEIRQ